MSEIDYNLLGKILFEEASSEEKNVFDEWLNQSDEHKEIFEAFKEFNDNTIITEYGTGPLIAGEKDQYLQPPKKSQKFPFRWAIAASIAAIMFISFFFFAKKYSQFEENPLTENQMVIKSNPRGQKSRILLPDGSKVWLNSSSSIEYSDNFSDTLRDVRLMGEAFFEVSKDSFRPFVVETGDLKTTVLGTSFNVKNYEDNGLTEVSLVSGKLKVTQENNSEILLPGNEVEFDKSSKHLVKRDVDINNIAVWKDGILVFKQESIQTVITHLERWYDVKITFSGEPSADWKFTGYFDNEYLQNVLEVLCFGKNLNYKIDGKNVTLTQKN